MAFLIDKSLFPAPETKADPRSLDAFIAWLKTQPADGSYDYWNGGNCLCCQFCKAQGLNILYWSSLGENAGTFDTIAFDGPWKYGDALQRAIAYRDKGAK